MDSRPNIHVLFTILMSISLISGCSDNPLSSTTNGKPASATVHVRNKNGSPLESVTVTMKNTFNTAQTDSTGSVSFTDIRPGQYEIGITREDIPLCWRNYLLEGGKHSNISMTVAPKLNVRVIIRDKQGPPLTNAMVTIAGTDNKSTTDDNGECTFTNVVMGSLSFNVTCSAFSTKSVIVFTEPQTDNNTPTLLAIVDIPLPKITFDTRPEDVLNYQDLSLSCNAIDAFGQQIPDSLIVWEERSFGEIGTGRMIESTPFKVGTWSLSVSVTDIYGYQNKITDSFYVYYYNPESYFPFPTSGYWQYAYDNPEIVIEYENYSELLVFSDLRMTMVDGIQMETTIEYEIHTTEDIDYAEYTVTDWYMVSRDSLLVYSSQEVLYRWDEPSVDYNTQNKSWIKTYTTYSTPILIMSDSTSPKPGENNSTTCTATLKWVLYDGILSRHYKYNLPATTICTISDTEKVSVNGESYDAVPVTIQQGETVKRWWLAQGIGIVRMEHPLNGTQLRANLTDMSIGSSAPETAPSFTASKRQPSVYSQIPYTVKASAPGIEGHLKLLRTLIQ